jgi:hypothetical protein
VSALTTASASTPVLAWRDVTRVGVQCVLQPTTPALQEALCERVRAIAAEGAPTPVGIIPLGEPAILQPTTTTLIVQAAIQPNPAGQGRLLVFTIRPFSTSGEAVLHGSAPRAVALPGSGLPPTFEPALRAALAEILPWQAR